MTISNSTGLRNLLLHTSSERDIWNRGIAKCRIFSGAAPALTAAQAAAGYSAADLAETGTLLCTVTAEGATVKAKQKIRFTPVIGTATAGDWHLTLNGTSVKYTGDGSVSISEVCTGLYNAWRVASGLIAATTPACVINNPDVYQLFTFTDNGTSLDIEAATDGVSFDYSSSVDGAGAGTATFLPTTVTADAYGIQFEAASDVTFGLLEKLASQTLRGTNVATGTASHFRLVLDSDTGVLSTTQPRKQGAIATANSDMNLKTVQFEVDDIQYFSEFSIQLPAA